MFVVSVWFLVVMLGLCYCVFNDTCISIRKLWYRHGNVDVDVPSEQV